MFTTTLLMALCLAYAREQPSHIEKRLLSKWSKGERALPARAYVGKEDGDDHGDDRGGDNHNNQDNAERKDDNKNDDKNNDKNNDKNKNKQKADTTNSTQGNEDGIYTESSSYKKFFTIWFENQPLSEVLANSYWGTIINQSSYLLTNHYGISYPSQPNYVGFMAGDKQGVDGDDQLYLDVENLVTRLEDRGKSWKGYQEDYYSNNGYCNLDESIDDLYYRKHNPFFGFTSITDDYSRCQKISGFNQFYQDVYNNDLPNFAFMTPNINNGGHDQDLDYSGAFLMNLIETWIRPYSNAWRDVIIFVTFEADDKSADNNVPAFFITLDDHKYLRYPGSDQYYNPPKTNHYALTKMICENFCLDYLGNYSRTASPIQLPRQTSYSSTAEFQASQQQASKRRKLLSVQEDDTAYENTQGYCRGGESWSSGNLWDCSPGWQTQENCQSYCSLNPDCAAFDQPNDGSGWGECCLFKAGSYGNGDDSRNCFVKQDSGNSGDSGNGGDSSNDAGSCDSYCADADVCDWTNSWKCDWMDGSQTVASDDGSIGYKCCCQDRSNVNQGCGGSEPASDEDEVISYAYETTQGYCRGGESWSSGNMWDCSPGWQTQDNCQNYCNMNSGCAAFDQPDDGNNWGECCLFKAGSYGNGDSSRKCMLKQDAPTPAPAPPTAYPTREPTSPTEAPTAYPTREPTTYPTAYPTNNPTNYPTGYPTNYPTKYPTAPTEEPEFPTTSAPTDAPTDYPTTYPTDYPTDYPTKYPTNFPTDYPTEDPTDYPTEDPTTATPTAYPTEFPTNYPTNYPTTATPTRYPTTRYPTTSPTEYCGMEYDFTIYDTWYPYGR